MESKRRPSIDDAASALRKLTHTPRLSLRRPTSTLSSASSIVSHDHTDEPTACVYTHTPRDDDCALNRFMVWAAVKRNICQKMTPEERRECPLLRCRKRFSTHEIMLRHLYSCDQLAAGEYWCYECEKVERFNDVKCKRCLGNPSKRRRIMGMAKNFFSSLGNKGKNGRLPDLDLGDVDETFFSFGDPFDMACHLTTTTPPLVQVELQNTEIFEIDSNEISLPTVFEEPVPPVPPQTELGPASLFSWQPPPQPSTIAPMTLVKDVNNADKPTLQLYTTGLGQYRSHAKAQSKNRSRILAPSSSVRSTASTDSNSSYVSTASCSSTASYNISPISAFSEEWAQIPPFGTTLTSPTDDLGTANSFKALEDHVYNHLNEPAQEPFGINESTDIPMIDVTCAPDSTSNHLDPFPAPSSFYAHTPPMPLSLVWDVDRDPQKEKDPAQLELQLTTCDGVEIQQPETLRGAASKGNGNTRSLVRTALGALRMHIKESKDRLEHTEDNIYVVQLQAMSTKAIALLGLESLTCILNGGLVTSPLDLICFLHLVYSFSLVIHENGAPERWKKLFSQAVHYSSWLTQDERKLYLRIVNVLWRPQSMDSNEVLGLMRKASAASQSRPDNITHQLSSSLVESSEDSLVLTAQVFLDELELAAIAANKERKSDMEVEASSSDFTTEFKAELLTYQSEGSRIMIQECSSFDVITSMKQAFLDRYSKAPALISSINSLFDGMTRAHGITPRQLELDLVQIGRMSLSTDVFFDDFVPLLRGHIDILFAKTAGVCNSRLTYHQSGVKLIQSLLIDNYSRNNSDIERGVLETNLSPYVGTGLQGIGVENNLGTILCEDSLVVGPDPNTVTIPASGASYSPIIDASHQNNESGRAATSPFSSDDASTAGHKVEADSCCELCGYRPEGDPRWFTGSMAKHMKNQHAASPPTIYRCRFPGCTSQYKNRADNLRQHQIRKGHFVDGDEEFNRRPSKRKKTDSMS